MHVADPHTTVRPSHDERLAGRRVSVVIPAKNEAGNIGWVLEQLPPVVEEVILVDGHSTDGTPEVARLVRPDIVVVADGRPGKGAALRAGVEAATGDFVVMLDADGSMDPRELERFLVQLRAGCDLVKGSRFMPGAGTADMTPLRDLGNRCLLALANVLFRSSHTDLCYGYAAFRREAFQRLGLTADGFEIEAQLFLRAGRRGLRVMEVPSFEAPRREGNSNLNTFRDGWRVLKTILAERLPRLGAAARAGLPAEGPRASLASAPALALPILAMLEASGTAASSAASRARRPRRRTGAPAPQWPQPPLARSKVHVARAAGAAPPAVGRDGYRE
jgi:hypothetical protein